MRLTEEQKDFLFRVYELTEDDLYHISEEEWLQICEDCIGFECDGEDDGDPDGKLAAEIAEIDYSFLME